VREESWLIVALMRSNDQTSEQADTGERGEDGPVLFAKPHVGMRNIKG
jgi:hypothetical protein